MCMRCIAGSDMRTSGVNYTIIVFIFIVLIGILGVFLDKWRTPTGVLITDEAMSTVTQESITTMSFDTILNVDIPTPHISLENLDGVLKTIGPDADGTTVYHFWASWCAPCIVEFPELLKRAKQESSTRFVLISIDDNVAMIKRFQERLSRSDPSLILYGDNIFWLHDHDKRVAHDIFNSFKVPESFIANDVTERIFMYVKGSADWEALSLK